MRPVIVGKNSRGNVELSQGQFERLLRRIYDEGYNDGYTTGCNTIGTYRLFPYHEITCDNTGTNPQVTSNTVSETVETFTVTTEKEFDFTIDTDSLKKNTIGLDELLEFFKEV